MINATVPADPRLRKRAIIIALTMTLVGLVTLYLFRRFLYEMEALATASPQWTVEQLNPIRTDARGVTLFSATALGCLLGYVAFSVYRAGQCRLPDGVLFTPCRFARDDKRQS